VWSAEGVVEVAAGIGEFIWGVGVVCDIVEFRVNWAHNLLEFTGLA
jgi:hypothetical protein